MTRTHAPERLTGVAICDRYSDDDQTRREAEPRRATRCDARCYPAMSSIRPRRRRHLASRCLPGFVPGTSGTTTWWNTTPLSVGHDVTPRGLRPVGRVARQT